VPGNSRFPNRWLAPLCLVTCCLTLPAQIHTVDPKKTITFDVAGATAAYSLDASLAEATAEDGRVSVTGKQPGATHVVVITPGGVQTFEVLVTTPPPHYPPGFVMPVNGAETAQSGYYEDRYRAS
jgi:Pilus formation protein N terminal region